MSQGFQASGDELKIEAGVKRLLPSASRGDIHAFADGVRSLQRKYGRDIADESMRRMLGQFPHLCDKIPDALPQNMRQELYAKSVELMVSVLEEAGLKVEEHIRVTDQGIGLTKLAVSAIAATGFPQIQAYGEGNDSLQGMGIDRTDGFVHPLSEKTEATQDNGLPEDVVNLWAVVSVVISGAQGWMEANQERCLKHLRELVSRAAPTADLDILLARSRYDDRALLKLCSLAHAGLEAKAQAATGA